MKYIQSAIVCITLILALAHISAETVRADSWSSGTEAAADTKKECSDSCKAQCPSGYDWESGSCGCNSSCTHCGGTYICKPSNGNGGSKSVSCSGKCKWVKPTPTTGGTTSTTDPVCIQTVE